MATIFRTPSKRLDKQAGKKVVVLDYKGQPVMTPRWRTVIYDHTGKRKGYTLTTGKRESQNQANMIEAREREIRNGLRPRPDKTSRLFNNTLAEYMAWGRAQGGRRGLPWSSEYASHKERDLVLWREVLGLERMCDTREILPKVEAECYRRLALGNSGKTVWNIAQSLTAFLNWCKKRSYLKENPLAALAKFDTEPTFTRRAMTVEEYTRLLSSCAPHRRLLYEVAACSGLRESELRALEPRHVDRSGMALRVERKVDKGRRKRLQPIPAAQGSRPNRRQPPRDPLLYVPQNSATMLKKDLEAAGIPLETDEGRLDCHALRTAYINFLMDLGANVKTTQELARHATVATTLNIYARARSHTARETVEALGAMLTGSTVR